MEDMELNLNTNEEDTDFGDFFVDDDELGETITEDFSDFEENGELDCEDVELDDEDLLALFEDSDELDNKEEK